MKDTIDRLKRHRDALNNAIDTLQSVVDDTTDTAPTSGTGTLMPARRRATKTIVLDSNRGKFTRTPEMRRQMSMAQKARYAAQRRKGGHRRFA